MAETVPTIGGKAPRPTRSSFARSLYDAIESNAGPSTLQEIIKLIPATDDAGRWDTAKPTKVLKLLVQNKSYGYFCETPDGRWSIAPLSYFNAQQEHARQLREGEVTRRRSPVKRSVSEVTEYVHVGRWEGAALFLGGALLGLLLGLFMG